MSIKCVTTPEDSIDVNTCSNRAELIVSIYSEGKCTPAWIDLDLTTIGQLISKLQVTQEELEEQLSTGDTSCVHII